MGWEGEGVRDTPPTLPHPRLSASWFGQGPSLTFSGEGWKPASWEQWKERWAELQSPELTASHSSAPFMLSDPE